MTTYLWLVYDSVTNCSHLVHDFFKPVHDLFMTCPLLVHDLFTTCLRLVHDWFKTFSLLVHCLFMTCSDVDGNWYSKGLLRVHYLFMTCLQLVNNLFMNFLLVQQNFWTNKNVRPKKSFGQKTNVHPKMFALNNFLAKIFWTETFLDQKMSWQKNFGLTIWHTNNTFLFFIFSRLKTFCLHCLLFRQL